MERYYQVIIQQPHLVHQFYSDASTMFRVDGSHRETAAAMLVVLLSHFYSIISLVYQVFIFVIFSKCCFICCVLWVRIKYFIILLVQFT